MSGTCETFEHLSRARDQRDVDALVSLCHEGCRLELASASRPIEGREAIREFHVRLFASFPDVRVEREGRAQAGGTVASWGLLRGMDGPWVGSPPTGGRVALPISSVCEFEDGRLRRERWFFDPASLRKQTRIPTPGEGFDERGAGWMERFRFAWRTGEYESLLDGLHPDASIFYPVMEAPVDKAGLRAFFEALRVAVPDLCLTPLTWAQRGNDALVVWTASGTVAGEACRWDGADRFTFDAQGRVTRVRAYFDPRELLERLTAARPGATGG